MHDNRANIVENFILDAKRQNETHSYLVGSRFAECVRIGDQVTIDLTNGIQPPFAVQLRQELPLSHFPHWVPKRHGISLDTEAIQYFGKRLTSSRFAPLLTFFDRPGGLKLQILGFRPFAER